MPTRPAYPCPSPGCGNRQPCLTHERVRREASDRRRGSASSRGYGATWRRLRTQVLAEEPLCRTCSGQGLTVPATEVDHIVSKERGGEDTRDNLQPLCTPCHSRKTVQEDRGFGTGTGGGIATVIAGPPGAGKSRWVEERRKWGDLVLDLDALYVALSGEPPYEKPQVLLPFVSEARDAIVSRLTRSHSVARAWIVGSLPKRVDRETLRRRLRAKVVVIETASEECLRRIASDPRRATRAELWRPIIDKWWREYERDPSDTVIA